MVMAVSSTLLPTALEAVQHLRSTQAVLFGSGHRLAWQARMGKHVLYLLCHRIDDVGFDGLGSIVAQRLEVQVADSRDGLVVHLLKRPAVPRPLYDRPPVTGD
jgi:hypothetical protein